MNRNRKQSLSHYQVIPRTVQSGVPAKVRILPCGCSKRFDDALEYTVRFLPMEIYGGTYIDESMPLDEVKVSPKNGVITVTYTFEEEQEWILCVYSPLEEKPQKFHVYSLFDDLYERAPFRGDLHAHSTGSDGKESPEVVAANYRKEGFDFMALTDHNNWHSSDQMIRAYDGIPLGIQLFHGEEVHLHTRGFIHLINFGGRYSVTKLFESDPEGCRAQIRAMAEQLQTPKWVNTWEYAFRKWAIEEIRKAGGLVILPHPFWIRSPEIYNMNTKLLDYVFAEGDYDAFELIGGQSVHENNLQSAFFQEQRAKGRNIPIVGSSDSHGTDPAAYFGMSKTVLFAKDMAFESICDAVRSGYSVAVEEAYGEEPRVYGSYRMVKYTRFLLDYYFPGHDELCIEEGRLMHAHVLGDPGAAASLRALSERCGAYRDLVLRGELRQQK